MMSEVNDVSTSMLPKQRSTVAKNRRFPWMIVMLMIAMVPTTSSSPTASFPINAGSDKPTISNGTTSNTTMKNISVTPTTVDEKATIIAAYVNRITLTNRTISLSGDEPEDKALQWMVYKDPILNILGTNVSSLMADFVNNKQPTYQQYRFQQRYSLLTIWFQQSDPKVSTWYNTTGWVKQFNECTWYGIDCLVINLGAPLGRQRVVTEILLSNNSLTGTISPELGLLSHVVKSQFSLNHLHGTIPSSLGAWTNMYSFWTINTGLTGSIPETIAASWTNISYFAIGYNTFTGTIPSNIGNYWTNLYFFSITNNMFSGTLPSTFGQLTSLVVISLENNTITGTLPSEIGQWIYVNDVYFSYNQFTGTIPSSINNWTAMEHANLSNNSLSGNLSVPDFCTNGVSTLYVDAEEVLCDCCCCTPEPVPVPPTKSPLAETPEDEKATIIAAYVNRITLTNRTISLSGDEPEDKALQWMVYKDPILNILGTNVSSLMADFVNNKQPTYQQYRFQQRYSLLTIWFQQSDPKVSTWYNTTGWVKQFNECTWYGIDCLVINLGAPLGRQRVVTEILLSNNSLTGTISPELGLLSHVVKSQFSLNHLHGTIPSSLGAWTNMYSFWTINTGLTGSIPETIAASWTNISYFAIGYNTFTGTIPSNIGNYWTNLYFFSITNNMFSGTLPSTFGQLTSLVVISLENNTITGTLPSEIGQWIYVNDVYFSYNQFTGTIPSSINNWTAMELANLRNNSLSGNLSVPDFCTDGVATLYVDNDKVSCDCCVEWD